MNAAWRLLKAVLGICGIATTLMAHAGEMPAKLDTSAFVTMSPADKVKLAVSVVDARDAALRNIRYKVVEDEVTLRKVDQSTVYASTRVYEFKRDGDKSWLHEWDYPEVLKPGLKAREENVLNWDGQAGRRLGLPPGTGTPNPQGRIDGTENPWFTSHRLGELLCYRIEASNVHSPMSGWVRRQATKAAKFDVTVVREGGADLLRVAVEPYANKLWRYEFTMDPGRGFMITRFERILGEGYARAVTTVSDARQLGGIWVPTKAVQVRGGPKQKVEGRTTFTVSDISLGAVKEAELAVTFPRGTQVIDNLQSIAYNILADHKYELLPLTDTKAGIVRVPPQRRIIDHIEDAGTLYTTQPIDPDPRPQPPRPGGAGG